MTVPFAFANLSGNIALAKLDSNFNTPITIGNTSVLLGNTITTINNVTLANVTITSGTSNVTNVNVTNVTVTNLTATLANVTTLNVASAYITSANIGTLALTNALPVSSGGTGQVTFPANSVLLGNGTGGIATVAPGNVGNVLTSIGGAWVSNVAMSGAAAGSNTQVQYNNSGALAGSANLTFNGTTLTANTLNLTNALGTTYGGTGLTSFTANGVVYASSSSVLAIGSALVFDGANLGISNAAPSFNLDIGNTSATSNFTQRIVSGASYAAMSRYDLSGTGTFTVGFNNSGSVVNNAPSGVASLWMQQNYPLVFGVNGSEQMRLTGTGLGIGTSSPDQKLTIVGNQKITGYIELRSANRIYFDDSGNTSSGSIWNGGTGPTLSFSGDGTNENMRLNSSGNLLVGTTSAPSFAGVGIQGGIGFASSGTYYYTIQSNTTDFYIGTSNLSRYAALSGISTFTAWTFGSDRRIKNSIQDINYGLAEVLSMKPRQYKFNDGDKFNIGFVAQELKEVVPEAVTGEEIEFSDDDTPQERAKKTMGVSKETLIPVLVKAIQEQQSLIQSLTDRIAQLEAKP
jgi:hypothetical protein